MNMASHRAGSRNLVTQLFALGMLLIAGSILIPSSALAEVKSEPWGNGGTKYTTVSKGKTHEVMKDKDGVKKEEKLTEKDKGTGITTTTTTTYTKDEKGLLHPDVTTIVRTDVTGTISKERQEWGKDGKQNGGYYQPGGKGKEYKYDPANLYYTDSDATPPSNGGKPPKYPEIGEGSGKSDKPKKPTKSKGGESKGKARSKRGEPVPVLNNQFLLPSSGEGNPTRVVTADQLSYSDNGQQFDVTVRDSVPYRETPNGGWVPIRTGDRNLYVEGPEGGWTQAYPRRSFFDVFRSDPKLEESTFFNTGATSHELKFGVGYRGAEVDDTHMGYPSAWRQDSTAGDPEQKRPRGILHDLVDDLRVPQDWGARQIQQELFPTGFECGTGFNFIFGADPIFHTETHFETVRFRFFRTEDVVVGHELVDADGIPGGPDIEVPIFDKRRVPVVGKKRVKVKTKEDVSVVENGDVGGNLNVHYWINQYVGVGASNAILSAPGGIVDILAVRAEARLPILCGGENHPFGFAPFVYAGCSGTFGESDSFMGLDIGGGFQVRTRCGFNCSLEAGADFNDTQNYGHGSFNIFWSHPLD